MKKKDILKLTDAELDAKVKIQGTKYDRKRKISDRTISRMKRMSKRGKTPIQIAEKLGISVMGVKYNLDPEFKKLHNQKRSGAHTGTDHITPEDRIAYKRSLVSKGKIKV